MSHHKAKLYKPITGTRQVIILGVDEVDEDKANNLQKESQICALLLEWMYDEKLELQKVSEMIDSLEEKGILEKAKAEKLVLNEVNLNSQQIEEIDLMSYLITGLAGDAFDEQGRITLGGLCDYINRRTKSNNKLKSSLVLPSDTEEWKYKTIRKNPETINNTIAKEISEFYKALRKGHVKLGIRTAVEIIQRLSLLANDQVLDILKQDVTNALRSNYEGLLNSWMEANGIDFLDRINEKRSELTNDDEDVAHSELHDLFETYPHAFRLEDHLSYEGFTKLMKDEYLLTLFTEICWAIMDTKLKTVMNPQVDGQKYDDPKARKVKQFDTIIRNYVSFSTSKRKSKRAKHDKSAFSGDDQI